jgi:hypothetical protein
MTNVDRRIKRMRGSVNALPLSDAPRLRCAAGSRYMELPRGRCVYRGLSDLQLPGEFLEEDSYGVRGGVEHAL